MTVLWSLQHSGETMAIKSLLGIPILLLKKLCLWRTRFCLLNAWVQSIYSHGQSNKILTILHFKVMPILQKSKFWIYERRHVKLNVINWESNSWHSSLLHMSRDMTKQTKWLCAQRKLISLRCPREETLGPWLPTERTTKTLIRLGGCPGWSESLLGIHSFCWFCHVAAHIVSLNYTHHWTIRKRFGCAKCTII